MNEGMKINHLRKKVGPTSSSQSTAIWDMGTYLSKIRINII